MADDGDKTEEPTDRKKEEARRKGQVAVSRDLNGGAVFIACFVTLSLTAESWMARLIGYFRESMILASQPGSASMHMVRGMTAMIDVLKAPLGAALLTGLFLGFMQTGGLFSVEALKIDPQRIMPNFKKLFSLSTVAEVVKGFVKVTLAGAVAYAAIEPLLGALNNLTGASPMSIAVVLGYGTDRVCMRIILVVAIVGGADLLWQRHSHLKGLRMSHDEIKREHKDSEGDPQHKHERKQFHKELLEQRMVNDVKKADFVVVNPTHIAVAIRYDKDADAAPIVLAKGERILAEKIKQAAREAGVPIFRDVGLARALRDVEEGDEVPEALYEAIAEILRVVYGQPSPSAAPVAPGTSQPGQGPAAQGGRVDLAQPAITSDAPRGSWRRG